MLEGLQLPPILNSRSARWLMVAGWMALIFFLSSQPQLPSPPDPLADLIFKKGAHFTVYAVLAVLWLRALPLGRWAWALSWALTVLYASSDEWHQSFVPGRHPQPTDVLIDLAGATAGLLLLWWLQRRARSAALPTTEYGTAQTFTDN
ncbi:MAG TPA: VanZ family protein [Roseiflexaceae bacterium]|nr:VanZ family protein [Roseiflexaceae bacterium]